MSDNQSSSNGQSGIQSFDLNNMDLSSFGGATNPTNPANSGSTQGTAGQTGTGASSNTKAFDLESAAMAEQNQTAMTPPDKYSVPTMVQQKFPDLVDLIKATESMNDDERDYWFQILPIMTEDQISKFREILLNEKMQLQKLDREYEQELSKLNEKHMIEWKEFETKEKRKTLIEAEKQSTVNDKAQEEDLLSQLASL